MWWRVGNREEEDNIHGVPLTMFKVKGSEGGKQGRERGQKILWHGTPEKKQPNGGMYWEGKRHLGSDKETDFEDEWNNTYLPPLPVSPSASLGADM